MILTFDKLDFGKLHHTHTLVLDVKDLKLFTMTVFTVTVLLQNSQKLLHTHHLAHFVSAFSDQK